MLPLLAGTPFLFVTAYGQIEQAVRLTKAGAVDYIAKPYALRRSARPHSSADCPAPARGALGASHAMRRIGALLRRVADVDSSLLFVGESGVGKEVAARLCTNFSASAGAVYRGELRCYPERAYRKRALWARERRVYRGAC